MLWSNLEATNSTTSAGTWMSSRSALSCRIAIRVSRSGGWTSTHRPQRNRLTQAVLEAGQLVRRPVGRDHDLLAGAVQVVERVEELGLGLLALGEELDVVDEQDVDLAVALAERYALAFPDGLDELGHELLGRHVLHADAGGSRCMWWPTANSRWVLPSPTPP